MDTRRFTGWMPIGLYWRGTEAMVDWCHVGDADFAEPFFEQTIGKIVRRPGNLLFRHQTPLGELEKINASLPAMKAAGFIFHMSRCGSTVVSRMLSALPENVVLSEPRLLDFIFHGRRGAEAVSDEERIFWLRAVIGALAQQRQAPKRNFVLKFDSWHTLHLPLIRRAFPEVPWIFVHREPVEVMVSHQRQPAAQMAPGFIDPRLIGLEPAALAGMEGDEYCARALAAICRAALAEARAGGMMFINYTQLPEIIISAVMPFFKLETGRHGAEQVRETARFNAKEPSIPFTPDAFDKQREAGERLRRLSEQWLASLHAQIEIERQKRIV